ncbi:hypothetical protein BGZ65_010833, partial [Modicella reniformis]
IIDNIIGSRTSSGSNNNYNNNNNSSGSNNNNSSGSNNNNNNNNNTPASTPFSSGGGGVGTLLHSFFLDDARFNETYMNVNAQPHYNNSTDYQQQYQQQYRQVRQRQMQEVEELREVHRTLRREQLERSREELLLLRRELGLAWSELPNPFVTDNSSNGGGSSSSNNNNPSDSTLRRPLSELPCRRPLSDRVASSAMWGSYTPSFTPPYTPTYTPSFTPSPLRDYLGMIFPSPLIRLPPPSPLLRAPFDDLQRLATVNAAAIAATTTSSQPSRPPVEARPGFTKTLSGNVRVMCPMCCLEFGHKGKDKTTLWVIMGCGHVVCGDCVDDIFMSKVAIKPKGRRTSIAARRAAKGKEKAKSAGPSSSSSSPPPTPTEASSEMEEEIEMEVDQTASSAAASSAAAAAAATMVSSTTAPIPIVTQKKEEEIYAPEETLFKLVKRATGSCPGCNRKIKKSSIQQLFL